MSLMVSVTFQEKKTLIRAALGQRTEKDDFRFRLDRWQQVVVMSLHVGHSRLNAPMFREMKLAPSPICNCGLEDQTAEHTAEVPASADSETKWPKAVQLHTKLYASREELEKAATFILQTGLSV